MLGESIGRNSLLLGFFAILSTAIIAGTYLGSQDIIRENIRQAEERALLEIVPKSRHNNSMLEDAHGISDSDMLGLRSEKKYYIARQDGEAVAVIFPATAREGYTGDIDMIIGINVDGTIAGARVLSHRETPGLGDGIDRKKSAWIDGFINKSLLNPTVELWKVKKDKGVFDQFTGATITPRAVTQTVLQTLQYFNQHQHDILKQPITAHTEGQQ
ncbi:electron transport complex subunit RsxG [Oceanicoccus sagamiensis]|uniref:Ion-translocating oxidoreductase complex subunit G n=1 Tax=Oceanicoccus sagamiensis TaxID=716816 RepID=A0A1X9NF20_9GAMM|nr:electron transport complex subunit RsxG [Oceanicoccus sagamiensis]ARN75042.1 electron transport complex subunit RsxG [Oceanicoccus sagamiensis]